jgi:hypothetical protein
LVHTHADEVIARAEQDEAHMEESGKRKKSVNVAKGKRKSPIPNLSCPLPRNLLQQEKEYNYTFQ